MTALAASDRPYDERHGARQMKVLRAQLMAAAVRYVREGRDGTMKERLRTASSLTGFPAKEIEIAAGGTERLTV